MKKELNLKKIIIRFIPGVLVIVFLLLITYLILKHFNLTSLTREELQSLIEQTGVYGKLCFVFISFLQVTFIPLPGAVTILAGNYLFGPWWSLLLSFIGMLLGSLFAFFLGKSIGRRYVDWAFGGKEEVDYYLNKLKGKETVLLFFMFVLPLFPDDALCSLAGITNIKTFTFTLIQIITRPISILGTLLFMSGEVIPFEGIGLVIIILVGILSIISFIFAYKNAEKINNFIENLSEKISKRIKRQKEK